MKCLLIYPYFIEKRVQAEDILSPPIGIYWVATLLKEHGHEVEVLNWHDRQDRNVEIRETLARVRPALIGFSLVHANRWGALEIARIAKELDPEVKIVFGGPGAGFLWRHFLTHFADVDYVVIGEGEFVLLRLVQTLEGQNPCLEGVGGIAYREGDRIVRTKSPSPIADLDSLPLPSRYFQYRHVASSRGCPWKCRFCGSPGLWNGKVRFRSPRHFVDELDQLYRKGITFFYVSDDTFTAHKPRVLEICRTILERGLQITWNAICRVDGVDEEILYWMRRAGCIQISYGVESGSEKIRAILGKKITTDQVKRAFDLTRSYGILPRAYFIYGAPGETPETIAETIALITEIQPLAAVFYILDLFPGTEFYERIRESGGIDDDVWLQRIEGLMYLELDPQLSDELVLDFGDRLRRAFYGSVHSFAESLSLVDRKDLYPSHADFCSRLAMTFTHGEYSRNEMVRDKERVAEKLFRKGLEYGPDERATLGLAILLQKRGSHREAIEVLREGIAHFPRSESLHTCMGVSHMNRSEYELAMACFRGFSDSERARAYMDACREACAGGRDPGPGSAR
jgi:anaerobic magnesium-protoporphyrin IX monomethyl ester cyclase